MVLSADEKSIFLDESNGLEYLHHFSATQDSQGCKKHVEKIEMKIKSFTDEGDTRLKG